MKNNKICVKINCYKGFDYNQTFDGIRKAGFRYVELSTSIGNSTNIFQDTPLDELERIKKDLYSRGIIPLAIGGNSFIMDEDTSKLIRNFELANFFGCKYIDTQVFNPRNDKDSLTTDIDVANHIKFYIPYLEQYNLDLVIELHGRYSTGKKINEILELVNSNHVHINYDTGNAIYWGGLKIDEMIKDLESCIDNVSYMHIKDKLDDIKVWNFPAVGKGYVPFKKIFDLLEKNNNDATLCAEVEFTENGVRDVKEVDQALKDSAEYFKKQNYFL